jgi:antitoxin ParD1/3/4
MSPYEGARRLAMQRAEKISITMTPEMMQVICASVASGEYASTSEALRDAARIWQRDRQEHAERLEATRQGVESSIDDRARRLARARSRSAYRPFTQTP